MLDQLLVLVWQAMQSLFPTKAVGMWFDGLAVAPAAV
jgi:hypothetical protein